MALYLAKLSAYIKLVKILAICAGLFLLISPVQGQKLYKWVDENGRVTYQDQPAEGAVEVQEVLADPVSSDTGTPQDPAQLAAAVNPVTLYSVPVCDACDLVRNILDKNEVPYTEKTATEDVEVQQELIAKSGQLSVPVLVVGDKVVHGYSSNTIRDQLANAGYPIAGQPARQIENRALTPEQVAEQAARAAAELTAGLDDTDEVFVSDSLDNAEEIPEDEQIKVQVTP